MGYKEDKEKVMQAFEKNLNDYVDLLEKQGLLPKNKPTKPETKK